MSTHLLIAAAYLEDLPQGTKLVLMAYADSADEHTLEAAPGLPKLRAWGGVSKSQALRITAALREAGYLEQLARGRLGRRAVYRVFPAGVPAIPHPSEVAARYADDDTDEQVVHNGENAGSYPQDDAIEGRTDATLGSHQPPSRVAPMRPLQSYPSVSSARDASTTADRCGQATPPAPPSTGFPGSRATADEERGVARRARGAMDRPCPVADHGALGEVNGGCGRCAHAAANADPDRIAAARKAARDAVAAARRTTTTEETRSA